MSRAPISARRAVQLALAVVLTLLAPSAWADGDVAAGKASFSKCIICHSAAPGVSMVGPSLFGIVGRHSAAVPGFPYSPAMKAADWTWTPERLDSFLTDPRTAMAGTRMIFPGLKSVTERGDLISYLATLK